MDNTSLPPSLTDLSYTYAYSKYICIDWVYPLHILFSYTVVLMGILAILARVVPQIAKFHVWFGRFFVVFMFWAMASSLLIHNTGMPLAIIISFLILLITLSIGWIAIRWWSTKKTEQITKAVEERINSKQLKNVDLNELFASERAKDFNKQTYWQRVLSLKTLHGVLMTLCWYQLAGRTAVTNPFSSWHGCETYPAIYENGTLQYLPEQNPTGSSFVNNIALFTSVVLIPILIIIVATTLIGNYISLQNSKKERSQN
eukprot:TRINITY_DN31_c0_g1_i1.p1 TRINITY_DN31_c0_g1~~TRINITY_DN31_c0_g1_i1.p1  ORF type:complete len:258 (+),score=29.76 TRINITY_DN31_c0_g1_i1:53-826(+)